MSALTASPIPWSTKQDADGLVEVLDSKGDRIAIVSDHRDADMIVDAVALLNETMRKLSTAYDKKNWDMVLDLLT